MFSKLYERILINTQRLQHSVVLIGIELFYEQLERKYCKKKKKKTLDLIHNLSRVLKLNTCVRVLLVKRQSSSELRSSSHLSVRLFLLLQGLSMTPLLPRHSSPPPGLSLRLLLMMVLLFTQSLSLQKHIHFQVLCGLKRCCTCDSSVPH